MLFCWRWINLIQKAQYSTLFGQCSLLHKCTILFVFLFQNLYCLPCITLLSFFKVRFSLVDLVLKVWELRPYRVVGCLLQKLFKIMFPLINWRKRFLVRPINLREFWLSNAKSPFAKTLKICEEFFLNNYSETTYRCR